ncbi:MAG: 6-bladed beta-propeller [Candidatus Aegiribacteria sp.]|nr:6-bladed beta-propeller [Candidatus Aegiribacteria sp.]
MQKLLVLMFSVLILALACGEQPAEDIAVDEGTEEGLATEEYLLPEADEYLILSDSIGIELGDSNYVFGQIAGADITPKGEIAILDAQRSCVSIFSPSGEFVQSIGRQGSGPGEFLLSRGMSFFQHEDDIVVSEVPVPDSLEPGLVVSDVMGGKLVYFNSEMEYMMDVQGFYPSPPAVLACVDNSAIVGMKPDFVQNEDGMYMGFTIGRWEIGETEPSVIYFESMSPFDPADLTTMQDDILSFGVTPEGIVLTASLSTEVYEFTVWSADGEELFTEVDENFERVPKTQEEIDLETEMVNNMMIQQGMPESMANWEPDPYNSAIAGLWVDGLDRIWVTKGTTVTPSFNVYDMDGTILFTAALDAGERASTWQVLIQEDRFLAFDADPELYPQVFIGNLPGIEKTGTEEEGQH